MTVIASFKINTCPILLGDLLISGDENLQSSLNIPTIGKITEIFPEGSGFVPTNLTQKIAIINDNLALAWAGTKISAKIIIRNLLKEAQKKPNWKLDDLSDFFTDYDKEHGTDVCLIGLSNDGKGIFSFGYGYYNTKYDSEKYGLIRLAGTGAARLKEYFDNFNIPPTSQTRNPLETAVSNTLTFTNYMVGLEKATGHNLLEYYGGGFEILSLVQNKFKKIDDITYLILFSQQLDNSSWGLSLPKTCIKYFYENDILLIKKADINVEQNDTLTFTNKSIYVVSPIYRNVTADEIPQKTLNISSFNSKFICSFIFFRHIDGHISALSKINYNSEGTHNIRFEDDALEIDNNYLKSIMECVKPQNDTDGY